MELHLDVACAWLSDEGWELCKATAGEGPGAVFATAVLALESGKDERVSFIVELGSAKPKLARGLVSALGWLPYERVKEVIRTLAGSQRTPLKRVGIAAAAVQRQHPEFSLGRALLDNDPPPRRRAVRRRRVRARTDRADDDQAVFQRRRCGQPFLGRVVLERLCTTTPRVLGALQVIAETGSKPRRSGGESCGAAAGPRPGESPSRIKPSARRPRRRPGGRRARWAILTRCSG